MRRIAAVVVLALALTACATLPPGSGPNQQLLATWGTQVATATATFTAIHAAAAIGCDAAAPPAIKIPRATCRKIDLAGHALEAGLHEAGQALSDRKAGKPVDGAGIFARLTMRLLELTQIAASGGVAWAN